MVLRLEAINPSTDAAVTGVTATVWSIYGYDASTGPAAEPPLPILVHGDV